MRSACLGIVLLISMRTDEGGASAEGHSFRSRRLSKNSNRYEESSLNSEENEFLKEYQNLSFRTIDESPENALANRSATITPRQPAAFRKKSVVEELNEKNELLRREVDRVEKILNQGERRKLKHDLLPQINNEALKQELSNAYKQIRIYENEVALRKRLFEHEGSFVDIIRKAELTLIERQDIVRRLEAEISETKKQSNELVKLLQDGHIRKEYANKSSRLHKEIKYYETMLKDEAALELADSDNAAKKRVYIRNMEEQLLSTGFSKVELALIRKQFEAERTTTSQVAKSEAPSEDRSRAAFDTLKGEVAILLKMQKDYQKKIDDLEKERNEATDKSKKSKGLLDETEKELEATEKQFISLKKNIDPAKLRPNHKSSNPNESAFSQFAGMAPKSGNPLEHRFEVVEAGYFNKRATVVNDRPIIGRKSAKIVELTIFENRTQFLGFQAVYQINETEKKGGANVLRRENERFFKEKTTRLELGDYFKSFSCAISKEHVITGITVVSYQGTVVKAGYLEGMKMDLNMEAREYPCCLYGSYTERGFEMLGVEKVESG